MRDLQRDEIESVQGGYGPLAILGAAVLLYEAANIAYEFGQGFAEGYSEARN